MFLAFSTMNNLSNGPITALGRELEARGFESLWMGEHSHIPCSRATPYPAGGELPESYKHMMDPFVTLTAVSMVTSKLGLGLGVALLLEREIFTTAKEIATLDQLSNGRLMVGVGVGWNEEELTNVSSAPWSRRYSALRESVAALRALWTEEQAEFHGEFYDFDPVWSYPKPVQQPHPPIVLGVAGRVGKRHAVEWADGWMPIDVLGPDDFGRRLERFRNDLSEAGRDPATFPISVVAFTDPSADDLKRYRDAGVDRVILGLRMGGPNDLSDAVALLDRYAPVIPEVA